MGCPCAFIAFKEHQGFRVCKVSASWGLGFIRSIGCRVKGLRLIGFRMV